MKTARTNGAKRGKRGMATALVAVTLAAIGVTAMPVGIALASGATARARAGITVFDLFDLSPEQFATMMTSSGE